MFMKTIYLFLSACCCLVLGACTAPEPTTQNNGIMGKWRLVEELGDPGDGSGTFQPVAKGAERILVFERGGSFREIRGPIYSSNNVYDTYELLEDNKIRLTSEAQENRPPMIWTYYELTPHSVTIGFSCIEACLGKFVAVP